MKKTSAPFGWLKFEQDGEVLQVMDILEITEDILKPMGHKYIKGVFYSALDIWVNEADPMDSNYENHLPFNTIKFIKLYLCLMNDQSGFYRDGV